MAAPVANDRKLAAEVRRMGLNKIARIFSMSPGEMSDREVQLHDELLKRMAPNFLPRLQEVTGEDGGPVKITGITGMQILDDRHSESSGADQIPDQEPEATGSV